ncbi:MAG: Na+/H+ antiporter [uncultured Propionibacteriaceae bacterium]|uniref:Na+/H+ antiporter n=1 Tax=uncultured Propionibacteriaceae bacterium TaxID=257457 RepID=A0A6J4NWQ6_9ACTN|nr:MAG: Na+/H+ antiporter [uncultured Propionibacteriaceae bacterium]
MVLLDGHESILTRRTVAAPGTRLCHHVRVHIAFGILAIVATVVAGAAVAERLRVPAPLLLMLIGIAGSFVPFIDEPELSSELVLVGFLPPLLYAAAIRTSVIDFRANRRSIAFLSILLVVITALGVGLITWAILPVPFAAAFALGAVVAPPDAVAATSIARRIGLPRRIITVLEGESLVNDATAITCLRLALIAIGSAVTVTQVTVGFLVAAVGGIAAGLAVAQVATMIRKPLNEPVLDTAISLMVPFAAYICAESLGWGDFHGSGVIAVVVAGLTLGHRSPVVQSGRSRLNSRINWATIQFLLENAVFLLIGLQTRRILANVAGSDLSNTRIALFCLAVLVGVIALRLLWVAAARVALFRRGSDDAYVPTWAATVVVGWAGLRGVVTLATALLIPPSVPHQPVLVFAAMVVTAGTLLLQGLSLPWLVRKLGLRGPDRRSDALQAATVLQSSGNAALSALERVRQPTDSSETVALLQERIRSRANELWERLGAATELETPAEEYRRLRLLTLQAEREEVLKIRASGSVDHEVIEDVLESFDIEESMLTAATDRSDRAGDEPPLEVPQHPDGSCTHLEQSGVQVEPAGSGVCEDCLREGTRPVHLRVCLTCGNVGCCDSSVGRHAHRHFHTSHHPVMRSFEPNESWRWCYIDERIS